MSEKEYVIIPPGEEHLWEPVSECAFPLSELRPPCPLTQADLAAIEAHKQKQTTE